MEQQLKILKALADETRLKIILALLDSQKAVFQIVKIVKKAQPTISLDLKVLENAEIIQSQKQGKFVFYSLKDKTVIKLLQLLRLKTKGDVNQNE